MTLCQQATSTDPIECFMDLDAQGVFTEDQMIAYCRTTCPIGPPPPSVNAVAWSAQAMWLLVAWGYWVDRHRLQRGLKT